MHNYTFIHILLSASIIVFMLSVMLPERDFYVTNHQLKPLWFWILLALNEINGTLQHFVSDPEIPFICKLHQTDLVFYDIEMTGIAYWKHRHCTLVDENNIALHLTGKIHYL